MIIGRLKELGRFFCDALLVFGKNYKLNLNVLQNSTQQGNGWM